MQQLVAAAIDIAAGQHDILIADEMGQRAVDRRHAGIEVPGEILARKGSRLHIDDMIGKAHRCGIEQARIDLMQQLLTLEGILDPFDTGIEIGGRAGDHRRGREDRRHIVENGVGAARRLGPCLAGQRLVGLAHRRLQIIEHLGELEASKALGVEPRHLVAPVEPRQRAGGDRNEVMGRHVGLIEMAGKLRHGPAMVGLGIDGEMLKLFGHQRRNTCSRGRIPEWAQLAGMGNGGAVRHRILHRQ